MPKGVEHFLMAGASVGRVGVESLMPKGVEHATVGGVEVAKNPCRISDAERR